MADLNKLTVQFIEATDYLKSMKGLKHYQIAQLLNLERPKYDQIRTGRRKPSGMEIKILTDKYNELSSFFKENDYSKNDNTKEDRELVKSLKDIISAKDEIIKMKDDKIDQLEKDLEISILAHAETLKRLYSEDEIDEEIRKRQNELNMINKKKGK